MVIEFNEARGNINKTNIIKVHVAQDALWLKAVGINKSKTEVIGIIMNQPVTTNEYNWGDLVIVKELDITKIPELMSKVNNIPNNEEWGIIHDE